MTPQLSAVIAASTAYTNAEQALDTLNSDKAILLSRLDELNAAITAQVPVVQQCKADLKTAAAGL